MKRHLSALKMIFSLGTIVPLTYRKYASNMNKLFALTILEVFLKQVMLPYIHANQKLGISVLTLM